MNKKPSPSTTLQHIPIEESTQGPILATFSQNIPEDIGILKNS